MPRARSTKNRRTEPGSSRCSACRTVNSAAMPGSASDISAYRTTARSPSSGGIRASSSAMAVARWSRSRMTASSSSSFDPKCRSTPAGVSPTRSPIMASEAPR